MLGAAARPSRHRGQSRSRRRPFRRWQSEPPCPAASDFFLFRRRERRFFLRLRAFAPRLRDESVCAAFLSHRLRRVQLFYVGRSAFFRLSAFPTITFLCCVVACGNAFSCYLLIQMTCSSRECRLILSRYEMWHKPIKMCRLTQVDDLLRRRLRTVESRSHKTAGQSMSRAGVR